MRLICLLNQCQHFPGFVYQKARLCPHSLRIPGMMISGSRRW
jgi:hypothetical protein